MNAQVFRALVAELLQARIISNEHWGEEPFDKGYIAGLKAAHEIVSHTPCWEKLK